jgi:hypothetical protein
MPRKKRTPTIIKERVTRINCVERRGRKATTAPILNAPELNNEYPFELCSEA